MPDKTEPNDGEESGKNGSRTGRVRDASARLIKRTADNLEALQDRAEDTVQSAADATQSIVKGAAKRVTTGVDAAQDAAGQAVVGATRGSRQAASRVGTATGGALESATDAVQRGTAAAVDKVFPEVALHTFMLPTGPRRDDFTLVFRFEEVFESLQAGILARPRIELWAADEGNYDLDQLGERLAYGFREQFEAERERLISETQPTLDAIGGELGQLEAEMETEAKKTFKNLAGWALLFSICPPLVLLRLWMGGRPRTKIFGLLGEHMSMSQNAKATEKELRAETKRLERDFRTSSSGFTRAVSRIKIRPHPQVAELKGVIDAVERGKTVNPEPAVDDIDVPNFLPYLGSETYLRWLPERLHQAVAGWAAGKSIEITAANDTADLGSLKLMSSSETI